jgi:hypothetical protein
MPTTLTGLLLFVVILLPGFAYLVGKERHGTERRLSPFRETVAIVSASIISEVIVLAIFAVIRVLWPARTPNIGALLSQGSVYLFGDKSHHGHYQGFAILGILLLAGATLIAYLATVPRLRRVGKWFTGPYPHESTVSAWWILFESWKRDSNIEVGCVLGNSSSIRGQFGSFNISADDSPDRDLILTDPIYYSPAARSAEIRYDASAVAIAARSIVAMFVTYIAPAGANPSPATAVAAAAPETQASLAASQAPPSNRQLASAPWPRRAPRPSALYLHQGARSARLAVLHGRAKPRALSPRGLRP